MARTPPGQTRGKVHRFVRDRLLAGMPPTLREVQGALGFKSVESARAHLDALVEDGKLIKEPGRARGYRLPEGRGRAEPAVLVPLLGRVPAGGIDAAIEDPQGYLPVHSRFSSEDLFALRVRGESMTGAGIMPGDVVIVRRQPDASSGEIVVALVDDEATVKTLKKKRGRIVLHPENPDYTPILPDPNAVTLLGKVIEVRRYLESLALTDSFPDES